MLSHTALRTIPFPNPPDQGPDVGTEAFFYGLKLSSCLGGGELIGPSMECDYLSGPQFNTNINVALKNITKIITKIITKKLHIKKLQ